MKEGENMAAQIAFDDGSLKNSFGILDSHRRLKSKNFLSFVAPSGLSKRQVFEKLGISRPKLYQSTIRLSDKDIHDVIIPFVMAADLAVQLWKEKKQAKNWMMTSNSYFFGKSPFEVAMSGDGEAVIQLLMRWLGRVDGQAF